MKKTSITFISMIVLVAMLLTACGVSVQVPEQISSLLDNPGSALGQAVGPTATAASPQAAPLQGSESSDLLAAYQGTLTSLYDQVSRSVVNIRVLVPGGGLSLGGGQLGIKKGILLPTIMWSMGQRRSRLSSRMAARYRPSWLALIPTVIWL